TELNGIFLDGNWPHGPYNDAVHLLRKSRKNNGIELEHRVAPCFFVFLKKGLKTGSTGQDGESVGLNLCKLEISSLCCKGKGAVFTVDQFYRNPDQRLTCSIYGNASDNKSLLAGSGQA
ncbi:MAG TPA: hypothetical protein VFT06_04455, partial [Flavisolibacter sp.]|nr:hypothetical protein [Flavisolibacter sp.]